MIGAQPARRAPWTELRPTPPQPITTTLVPALTLAVLTTAPIPVSTPQAISDALSVEGPAIVDATVVANEIPNVPHLDLETLGQFARAKIKEAVLAFTGC